MEGQRFDHLAKLVAVRRLSRRAALRSGGGGLLATVFCRVDPAGAEETTTGARSNPTSPVSAGVSAPASVETADGALVKRAISQGDVETIGMPDQETTRPAQFEAEHRHISLHSECPDTDVYCFTRESVLYCGLKRFVRVHRCWRWSPPGCHLCHYGSPTDACNKNVPECNGNCVGLDQNQYGCRCLGCKPCC